MPKAKKRGRPPLPKGRVKGRYVPVRLTDEDAKLFEKAANASEHTTLSGWIRQSLKEAATKQFRG
jgi:uncharacterized protein (DUF1778 family)